MGTEITLDVAGITLTYSKNEIGFDHGVLFQEKDRRPIRSKVINYEYFQKKCESPTAMEMAFVRQLKEIVPRLELLGFTLDQAKSLYTRNAAAWEEERSAFDDVDPNLSLMSFDEFKEFVTRFPLQALDDHFYGSLNEESKTKIRGRFADEAILKRIPYFYEYDQNAYSEQSFFAELISIIHPYAVLRLLAENNDNLDTDVVWQYGPLVTGGYAEEREFVPEASRRQTFLVVTEGSSDAYVLKYAFALLRPEVADFFRFIDVAERHPFPGTGNLLKFAEGLVKIDVHNKIVFLFDNDAEGDDTYRRLLNFKLPQNMRAMILPELEELRNFPAKGPQGRHQADINRCAAAIECYLDLEFGEAPSPLVTWTNFKKELGVYQGSLDYKEVYIKEFLKLEAHDLMTSNYDTTKLHIVLNTLLSECSTIADEDQIAAWSA